METRDHPRKSVGREDPLISLVDGCAMGKPDAEMRYRNSPPTVYVVMTARLHARLQ